MEEFHNHETLAIIIIFPVLIQEENLYTILIFHSLSDDSFPSSSNSHCHHRTPSYRRITTVSSHNSVNEAPSKLPVIVFIVIQGCRALLVDIDKNPKVKYSKENLGVLSKRFG
ncbi:hypothetical protein Hdeb2414_s0021g00575411 [Helianthus debilis subsp. tardiflorus]